VVQSLLVQVEVVDLVAKTAKAILGPVPVRCMAAAAFSLTAAAQLTEEVGQSESFGQAPHGNFHQQIQEICNDIFDQT